jgi:hypothetical protein
MQCTFIINGIAQLVLIPENDLDKLLLDKVLDGSNFIEAVRITQNINILGKSVNDSVIFKKKTHSTQNIKEDDTSET